MISFKNWLVTEDMLPYDPVDGNLGANSQMGIASKYIGPDETGEKDPKRKQPLADFGFNRKSERLKKRLRRA